MLADLDAQIATADARVTAILPATRYQVLTTVPDWGPLCAGGYAAAVGDPDRWPAARQIYRAAGHAIAL